MALKRPTKRGLHRVKRYVTKLEKKPSRLRLACFALKVFKRMAFEWFEMISQKVCDEIVKGTNKVFFIFFRRKFSPRWHKLQSFVRLTNWLTYCHLFLGARSCCWRTRRICFFASEKPSFSRKSETNCERCHGVEIRSSATRFSSYSTISWVFVQNNFSFTKTGNDKGVWEH